MKINLFESDDSDDVKASPFFDHFPNKRFYHGTHTVIDEVKFINFRYRDAPRDTIKMVHDYINKLSTDKFGIPVRNLLFCSTNIHTTMDYGDTYIVVPKGNNYRIFSNPNVKDMTFEYVLDTGVFLGRQFKDFFMEMIGNTGVYRPNFSDEDFEFIRSFMLDKSKLRSIFRKTILGVHHGKVEGTISAISHNVIYLVHEAMATSDEAPESLKEIHDIDEEITRKLEEYLKDKIHELSDDYVSGLVEIHDEDDIEASKAEFMLYCPDGFWLTRNI